jgi:hypothetical protein
MIIGIGQNNIIPKKYCGSKNIMVLDFALKSDRDELLKIKEHQDLYDVLLIKNTDIGLNCRKSSSRESNDLCNWFSCYKAFGFQVIICLTYEFSFVDKFIRDFASVKFDLHEHSSTGIKDWEMLGI